MPSHTTMLSIFAQHCMHMLQFFLYTIVSSLLNGNILECKLKKKTLKSKHAPKLPNIACVLHNNGLVAVKCGGIRQ